MINIAIDFGSGYVKYKSDTLQESFQNVSKQIEESERISLMNKGFRIIKDENKKLWAVGGNNPQEIENESPALYEDRKTKQIVFSIISTVLGKMTLDKQAKENIALIITLPHDFSGLQFQRIKDTLKRNHKFSAYLAEASRYWNYNVTVSDVISISQSEATIHNAFIYNSVLTERANSLLLDCGYDSTIVQPYTGKQPASTEQSFTYSKKLFERIYRKKVDEEIDWFSDTDEDEAQLYQDELSSVVDKLIDDICKTQNFEYLIISGGFSAELSKYIRASMQIKFPSIRILDADEQLDYASVKGAYDILVKQTTEIVSEPQENKTSDEVHEERTVKKKPLDNSPVKQRLPIDKKRISIRLSTKSEIEILYVINSGVSLTKWVNNCLSAYMDNKEYVIDISNTSYSVEKLKSMAVSVTISNDKALQFVNSVNSNVSTLVKKLLVRSIKHIPIELYNQTPKNKEGGADVNLQTKK